MSSEIKGDTVDLHAITDGKAAAESGVPHADVLVTFAEAVVVGDAKMIAAARRSLEKEVGPKGLVDAAAVVANFQRMVRVADATGIELDGVVDMLSEDMRVELGIDRMGSSVNTPEVGPLQAALRRALRPLALPAMKLMVSLAGRRARSG